MKLDKKVLLFIILLLGIFLRFWGIQWGLPYEYQSEEYKIIKYALKMGSGDLNPHFFEYPSLYLYFMLFLDGLYFLIGRGLGIFKNTHDFALSFVKDPTVFYLMGRISEAICGTLIIFLVYKIGKKLFSEEVGLYSAAIVCGLPHYVYTSHIIKGNMGAITLLMIFFLMTLRIVEIGDKRSYILSAMFLGLAASTKYHAAPFGILLPVAHFLRMRNTEQEFKNIWWKWEQNKFFLFSLILVPIFFIFGTPYSVLSPQEFYKDIGGNINIYTTLTGTEKPYLYRLFTAGGHLLHLGDISAPLLLELVCVIGFFTTLFYWENKYLLIWIPIVTYLLIVGGYHNPAGGYLLPVFPLFIIGAVHGMLIFKKKILKLVSITLLTTAITWNLWEGGKWAYSFTVVDTRTTAKEWIDKNIPQKSHILIDTKVQAPPIQMCYEQLEKYYLKAVELNYYKKEYLKLQLEAHPDSNVGYYIFTIKRSFRQIGSLAHQVDEVQKLQDLVEVDQDIKRLKKIGIEYVIVDEWSEKGSLMNNYAGLSDFYRALPAHAKLLKVFSPRYPIYHGGEIRIYQL